MNATIRIFVYGTLRRGGRNHRLLETATYVRRATTVPGFTMFDLGGCPAVDRGGRDAIVGELYDVDAHTLARLDRLEGHPTLYCRAPVELDDGSFAMIYIYKMATRQRVEQRHEVVASGDWMQRRSTVSRL